MIVSEGEVRMKKQTKTILAGSALIAAGVAGTAALSSAVTHYLVRVALDRRTPKDLGAGRKKLTGEKNDRATTARVREAAHTLESENLEMVETTAMDGVRLVGHWRPCRNPKRVILAMHGWRSSWTQDFGMISDFFYRNGCSVLFVEQRGQGASGGDYMGFGLTERYDCLEWVNWINERTDSLLPVYLCGVSMGAATVLMASDLMMPENVAGIIADCGFTSPYAIWKHVLENHLHLSYGIREAAVNDLCRRKIRLDVKSGSAVESLKNTDIPVLFIHGTEDHFVPIEMTYENYQACASEKYLLVVPGAEHAMSYLVERKAYENALLAFWNRYDISVGRL